MEIKNTVQVPKAEELFDLIIYSIFNFGLPSQEDIDKLIKHRKTSTIIVASTPRCGAGWLTTTLIRVTDFPHICLSTAFATNEQDLYLPALCMTTGGCVSTMHMKGTYHNNELLKMFKIKLIILVRNIYDVILNLANNLKQKQKAPCSRTGALAFSFMWGDVSIERLDNNEFLNALIDFAVPWYVNFYVSWYRLEPDALWITCEELESIPDRFLTVRRILSFLNIIPKHPLTHDIISQNYDSQDGEPIFTEMSTAHKIRIAKYFDYYSDVDFTKYGMMKK